MSQTLTAKDLFGMMHSKYPGIEDGRDDHDTFEHPLTGVGVVLLSTALLGPSIPLFSEPLTHYGSRPQARSMKRGCGITLKLLPEHNGYQRPTPKSRLTAACCTGMSLSRFARGHGNPSLERVRRLTAIQEQVVSLTLHKTASLILLWVKPLRSLRILAFVGFNLRCADNDKEF